MNGKTKIIIKNENGTKFKIAKNATVETVVADAKANITGSGKVENLEANADGITVNKNNPIKGIINSGI